MQNKPNETNKIIALSVAIIAVLVFFVWRVIGIAQQANTPATGAGATGTTAGGTVPGTAGGTAVTPASATTVALQGDRPGLVREVVDGLDDEPTGNQVPPLDGGKADAFRAIKKPEVVKPPQTNNGSGRKIKTTLPTWANIPGGRSTDFGPGTLAIGPQPVAPPPLEVKLDGVVTGPDGFAMLTIHDPADKDKGVSDQTVFKRPGEKIQDYRIVALSENGVTLKNHYQVWGVGQTLRFGQRPVIPVTADADVLPPLSSPKGVPHLGFTNRKM